MKYEDYYPNNISTNIDETKLIALEKLSETKVGEIYFGKYFIDNQSKYILIKIIKTNLINSSK
jgi:hypothetical protein